MKVPKTRYAKSGDVHIAYQVVGEGPIDLVFVPGFVSHVEHFWSIPWVAQFFTRLASFSRLIVFDKRGTGHAGAEASSLREAIEAEVMLPAVAESMRSAVEVGVTGTPAWLIDGRFLVPGTQSRETYAVVIERMRSRKRS